MAGTDAHPFVVLSLVCFIAVCDCLVDDLGSRCIVVHNLLVKLI